VAAALLSSPTPADEAAVPQAICQAVTLPRCDASSPRTISLRVCIRC
jgi:hypothetical protein